MNEMIHRYRGYLHFKQCIWLSFIRQKKKNTQTFTLNCHQACVRCISCSNIKKEESNGYKSPGSMIKSMIYAVIIKDFCLFNL